MMEPPVAVDRTDHGIDTDTLAAQLLDEGAASFVKSWNAWHLIQERGAQSCPSPERVQRRRCYTFASGA